MLNNYLFPMFSQVPLFSSLGVSFETPEYVGHLQKTDLPSLARHY